MAGSISGGKPPGWFLPNPGGTELPTRERCFITELMNTPDEPGASLALARVEPGVTTQLHRLRGVTERLIVRRGSGTVEVDGVTWRLSEGDAALIPAGAAQRVTSDGPGDFEFFCLCTPRFRADCYEALGA